MTEDEWKKALEPLSLSWFGTPISVSADRPAWTERDRAEFDKWLNSPDPVMDLDWKV